MSQSTEIFAWTGATFLITTAFFVFVILGGNFILPKAEWNCFEHINGQCTAYNFKGE
jgi:hypothetical protein